MHAAPPSALEQFHHFVGQQLQSEAAGKMSPEQAVALWHEHVASMAAIHEGLADLEAGRTRPAEEVLRELRGRLGE
ncbi:MAG: hypothetical protein SFV23_04810 [Planctomycetaceae bacterium]|nr:hypothetical protein [Planctomycetaceae bacterium]